MRVLLVALACAAALPAQLALYTVEPERRIESAFHMGSIAAGDVLEMRFQLRNIGPFPEPLTVLDIAGTGFSMTGDPALPQTVWPGTGVEFTVRFAPARAGDYSAALVADSVSVILLASTTASLRVAVEEEGGGWSALSSEMVVDFGDISIGAPAGRRFALSNLTGTELPPAELGLTPGVFSLGPDAPAQAVVPPGETVIFTVSCAPESAGVQEALLKVGVRQFRLRVNVIEPPLPRPEFVIELDEPGSARQGRVSVRFAEPPATRGGGVVRLEFEPAPGLGPDPAVLFANGHPTAVFAVEAGEMSARFGERSWMEFQTGSTAGNLVFTIEGGGHHERYTLPIAPAPVGISRTRAVRAGAFVEVEIAGWDNTRAVSELSFTFFDKSGKEVAPGAIRVDATEEFRRHFDTAGVGGVFLLRAVFPVTGGAGVIDAVQAALLNPAGTGQTGTLRLSGPD